MAIYTSFNELNGKTLQYNDKVVIKGIHYEVKSKYLNSKDYKANDAIFEELGLDAYAFTSEFYMYEALGGDWPEYKYDDYEAATRCVLALFALVEGSSWIEFDGKRTYFKKIGPILSKTEVTMWGDYKVDIDPYFIFGEKGCTETVETILKKIEVMTKDPRISYNILGCESSVCGKILNIGCQSIPLRKVEGLINRIKKAQKKLSS